MHQKCLCKKVDRDSRRLVDEIDVAHVAVQVADHDVTVSAFDHSTLGGILKIVEKMLDCLVLGLGSGKEIIWTVKNVAWRWLVVAINKILSKVSGEADQKHCELIPLHP